MRISVEDTLHKVTGLIINGKNVVFFTDSSGKIGTEKYAKNRYFPIH